MPAIVDADGAMGDLASDAAPAVVDAAGDGASMDAADEFRAAAMAWAETRDVAVESWWSAKLDDAGGSERVARLCPTGFGAGYYLVEDGAGRRQAIRFQVDGRSRVCRTAPGKEPRAFEERAEHHIAHPQGGRRGDEELWIALRGGAPVVLRRKLELVEEPSSDEDSGRDELVVEDWEHLVIEHRQLESGTDRKLLDVPAAILPVLDGDAPAAPTKNVVIGGRADWSSEFDANVQVAARAAPDGILLRVDVTDDERQPPPAHATERSLLAADHVEVWWCNAREPELPNGPDGADAKEWDDPALHEHPPSCLRGLLVAAVDGTGGGGVEVRWLRGAAATLPRASGTADSIELHLPASVLSAKGAARAASFGVVHLSVLYVDRDQGRGSVIGTSRFDRARPSTLGLLVDLPRHARYPALGDPVGHAIAPMPPGDVAGIQQIK